jgi:hypothetical protein
MSERARKSALTKLKRGDVYVANIFNLSPPDLTRPDLNVTDHDITDNMQKYVGGIVEGGQLPIEGHLIPTKDSQMGLAAALHYDEDELWTIEFPTVPVLTMKFMGYVNRFKIGDAPVDGKLTYNAQIKVNSRPIFEHDVSDGLTALVLTGSTSGVIDLAPAFDGSIREYFASVDFADSSVTVTPTADSHTITVNGATVISEAASGSIALGAGTMNTIEVRAQETGKAPLLYTLKVYREEEEL